MPKLTANGINVVLSTISHASTTVEQMKPGWNKLATEALDELGHTCRASMTKAPLREITIHEDADELNCLRWIGGRCTKCGRKEDGDDIPICERDGKMCERGEQAQFHLIMVESGGDQQSETDRKREKMFAARGIYQASQSPQPVLSSTTPDVPFDQTSARQLHAVDSPDDPPHSRANTRSPQTAPLPPDKPGRRHIVRLNYGLHNIAKVKEIENLRGLCVAIDFTSAIYPKQSFAQTRKILCVKVDVYCNGEYLGFCLVNGEFPKPSPELGLVHFFHGMRVGKVGERPLVVRPSEIDIRSDQGAARALGRWNEISTQLEHEASKIYRAPQVEKANRKSELSKYLEDLAELPLPQQVADRQSAHGRLFGVIDVVVTFGLGAKFGPDGGYLNEPTQMDLKPLTSNRKCLPRPRARDGTFSRDSINDAQQSQMPEIVVSEHSHVKEANGGRTRKRSHHPVDEEPHAKRSRVDQDSDGSSQELSNSAKTSRYKRGYADVPESKIKPTLEEQFAQAHLIEGSGRRRIRVNYQSSSPTSSSTDRSRVRSVDQKSHKSAAERDSSPLSSVGTFSTAGGLGSERSHQRQHSVPKHKTDSSVAERIRLHPRAKPDAPSQTKRKPRPNRNKADLNEWSPGPHHKDSVISYDMNKFRHLRSERTGKFSEEAVVAGIRYVVF